MATHGKMSAFDGSKESWTSYSERLDFYFKANKITAAGSQKAVFITVIGARTYGLLKSLLQPKTPQDAAITLDKMKEVLQKHFDPKPSPIVQRFKFHTRVRKQVATYVAELRVIGEHCDFQDSLDAMIRDRLVCGINSIRIQRRLLQEPDLDYEKAFQIAQAMELAAHDVSDLHGSKSQYQTQPPVHNLHHKKDQSHTQSQVECYRCGGDHYATKCKFIAADCRLCGKKGHLARVCRSRKEKPQQQKNPPKAKTGHPPQPQQNNKQHPTHNLDHKSHPLPMGDSDQEDYPLFTLPSAGKPIVVSVSVNKVDLSMELDTGASLSIMSQDTYSSLSSTLPPLSPSHVILTTYTGEKIKPVGA